MITENEDERITENSVRDIWRFRRYPGHNLYTEDGRPLTVIYPGRPNNGSGADFIDAVILMGGKLLTGDVEIHVYTGDWRNHGHHLNESYNRVVLHAVMWHKPEKQTVLQNGKTVPVLVLDKYAATRARGSRGVLQERNMTVMPCTMFNRNVCTGTVAVILDRMGDTRFDERVGRIIGEIQSRGAGESLYRRIMESLGYSGNKTAFIELAGLLPLRLLEKDILRTINSRDYLLSVQSLLLGAAGFYNPESERLLYSAGIDGRMIERLKELWAAAGLTATVHPDSWRFFRIRPGNSPIRRLMAMSYLLQRYRKEGLLKGLLALVSEAVNMQSCKVITSGLIISPDFRTDSGSGPACERGKSTMLGKNRAGEIAVNVLLPFYYAWYKNNTGPGQSLPVIEMYRSFPRNPENSLERHMREQLDLDGKYINTARKQQGLIHVYKNFCTRGKCGNCELGEFKSGGDIEAHSVAFTGFKTKETAGSYHCSIIRA